MEDNFKILIADDEPEILSLLEKALKLEGFNNIIKAQNGTDAVSLCKTEAPDAVWDHGFSGSCGSGIRNTSRFLRNRRMGSSGILTGSSCTDSAMQTRVQKASGVLSIMDSIL